MELAHLIAFKATLLAAILSPGPAMLYFIRTTLASGQIGGALYCVGFRRDGGNLDRIGVHGA
ncbi:hypothetical protein [Planktotalea sp.]|uniref:hypothetical protein n=1 Tax=Planktotalea sp. TaxID=2029877 RepID=UPI0035C7F87B